MQDSLVLIGNEYMFNKCFRDYVDRYCKENEVTRDIAFTHKSVLGAYRYYKDV